MANESLLKEAESFKESKRHRCFRADVETVNINYESYLDNLKQAYLAGAEPREKRIADLEWQFKEVVKDNDFFQAENKRLEKENAELKVQLEQMKCCGNCRWEHPCSFCDDCKRLEGQIFSDILTSDNWELKEIEK